MDELAIPATRPVRLWVYDEMRYGLHPLTRKMWCLRGVRAIAPSRRRYQNGYLYGALEVGGSGAEFLFTESLCKDWDACFLHQMGPLDKKACMWSSATGQGSTTRRVAKVARKRKNHHAPGLQSRTQSCEKLWDIVKDGICNRDWSGLKELETAIEDRIRPYWEDARKVVSLIGTGYLLSELNVTPQIG